MDNFWAVMNVIKRGYECMNELCMNELNSAIIAINFVTTVV